MAEHHHQEEQGCVLPVLNGPETMEKAMKSKDDQVEDGNDGSSSSSSSSSPSSPLPIHVLVVDDSPIDRKIIEKLLTKAAAYKGICTFHLSFSLSLYTHTHTHTHTRRFSPGYERRKRAQFPSCFYTMYNQYYELLHT